MIRKMFTFRRAKLRTLKDLLWFRILLPFLSMLAPYRGWLMASVIGRWWARDYVPAAVVHENLSGKPFCKDAVIEEMYRQWAVSSVVNYSFPQWDSAYVDKHMVIMGDRESLCSLAGGPVFFFSGHCFFMYAIVTLLGTNGHTVYAVSLDPRTTVPSHLSFVPDRIVSESTALLRGGGYLFTTLEGKFNRNIVPIMQKKTVYAAVDFPKNDFRGEWETVRFLEGGIEVPSRLFKFIVKHDVPSFFVHLRWDRPLNKLMCDIEKLAIGANTSVDEACKLFAAALEQRVIANPGSWEGWKWADVLKCPVGGKEAHVASS